MKMFACLGAVAVAALACAPARAQVTVTPVLENLNNPCGLAVQPETGALFVSDSGAGRIFRLVDGQPQDVIVGFPKDVYGKGPKYAIGPLGLLFLDQNTLVVGGGGLPDGEELLRIYTAPEAGAEPIQADDMKASFRLEATEETKGEGNFYALAQVGDAVFASSNGDDTKGWVARLEINDQGEHGPYTRFLATKEAVNVDAPVGVAVSPRDELVVGQMGEINIPKDSLLTFYNSKNGKLLLNLETGLFDIASLAYSPTGQLYALDFAWMAPEEGGLFHLVSSPQDGKPGVKPFKLASLDKPSAMAFGPDGTLYITLIGSPEDGENSSAGKLVEIAPGL